MQTVYQEIHLLVPLRCWADRVKNQSVNFSHDLLKGSWQQKVEGLAFQQPKSGVLCVVFDVKVAFSRRNY